jgi:hypothetical protein
MSTSPQTQRSSIFRPSARQIPKATQLALVAAAAGHCQLDGCNRYLFEHDVTRGRGNFSQMGHIYAFNEEGPRGTSPGRPPAINDIDNLILLCGLCHKLIDDNAPTFTVEVLRAHKCAHEERMRHVTSLGPDRGTVALVVRAPIAGQIVQIPFEHIVAATAPRYPISRQPVEINLTGLKADDVTLLAAGCETIRHRIGELNRPEGEAAKVGHVSLFALAPIPLLVFLGTQLSSKLPLSLYQRHRDTEDWKWKAAGPGVEHQLRLLRDGDPTRATLLLSLSGSIDPATLPEELGSDALYEIRLKSQEPTPTYLMRSADLETFRVAYQDALATILRERPKLEALSLVPAVPAPIAVLCGRELLPRAHPRIRVYDKGADKQCHYSLEVNKHEPH